MIILGIDPGLAVTGYGIVRCEEDGDSLCLEYGTIRSDARAELAERLKGIYDGVSRLLEQYHAEQAAFEDVFYGRDLQAALKLGQARGAAMIAAVNAGLEVAVYSPRQVKQALTGNGAASKEQVQQMVAELLRLPQPPTPIDASDALAVAVCHAQRQRSIQTLIDRTI